MAFANGRIPAKNLAALPLAFSNKREQEHLTKNAYASLVRMMLRAVADTGSYFSVWDAYRSMDEQVAMLKRNYTRVSRGRSKSSDRSYGGSTWAKKPGRPLTASPGYSNHGNGLAVDIHPAAIQSWLKSNAGRFGWVNDVPSEPWHWSYLNPGRDRYRGEGLPNVKAMQAKLGIEQDGKPGPDFVKHVKKFQKKNGLEVDGKAGPSTVKAILSGKGESAPVVVAPAPDPVKTPAVPGRFIPRAEWLGIAKAAVVLADHPDRVQTEIYIHYPGQAATIGAATEASTKNRLSGYYRSHVAGEYNDVAYNLAVDQSGNVWELRGVDRQSGANGGTASNRRGQSILCLLGNDEAPSGAMLAGIEDAIKRVRAVHPTATKVLGHQQSPDAKTECPGASLMALIRAGKIGAGTPAEGAPVVKPPAPAKSGKVTEDGRAGRETIGALQRALGVTADGRAGEGTWRALQRKLGVTPADGKIGWQSYRPHELGNGIVDRATAWGFTGRGSKGSPTVKALQKHVGLKGKDVDGIWHDTTSLALQRALNAGRF